MIRKIAVLDLETDPFEFGKTCDPFVAGIYDGETYVSLWGNDCIQQAVYYLASRSDNLVLYAHNGGRFDWLYFLPYLQGSMKIINGRIVKATLGEHEIRDSFSIMPFPLRDYRKDEIDYNKLRKVNREKNKAEILSYLQSDCVYLYELLVAFHKEFGDALTIGTASMRELKRFHSFDKSNALFDGILRDTFYYGGRCQCFESGIIKDKIKVYDVNSMYPHVMKTCLHPVGVEFVINNSGNIGENTCFVVVEGENHGAFCSRDDSGNLTFTKKSGIFYTTIHEWKVALETNTFRNYNVIKTYGFQHRITFEEFVDHFYNARLESKANKDAIHTLFYKYVLNSCYGKFAQNGENFFDWKITGGHERPTTESWKPAYVEKGGEYIIWKRPLLAKDVERIYKNVATGASITGAARAILLAGISTAERPMYCDTDSIICRNLPIRTSNTQLGSWKVEDVGNILAIAGKKLYALFSYKKPELEKGLEWKQERVTLPTGEKVYCIKKAHKGGKLTGLEIYRIAMGETIVNRNPVPAKKLDGSVQFTERKFRRTA